MPRVWIEKFADQSWTYPRSIDSKIGSQLYAPPSPRFWRNQQKQTVYQVDDREQPNKNLHTNVCSTDKDDREPSL